MIEWKLLLFILIMITMGYIVCYPLIEYKSDFFKISYHVLLLGSLYGLMIMQLLWEYL
jgi:uncharacterized membrane protein